MITKNVLTFMKQITKYLLLTTLLLAVACLNVTIANDGVAPVNNKLSISTQMFLDELQGDLSFDQAPFTRLNAPGQPQQLLKAVERPYVTPDTIDGKVYISSFVYVTDDETISMIESLGVVVETRFQNGLLTALLPVDRIREIAAVEGVKRIEVSPVMQLATDESRKATNVDDVLSYLSAALAAGLPKGYDGRGVILGVIDRGIDFEHIAFQDKNGKTRIKRAYVYNSGSIDYYGTGPLPKDGVNNTDHGSHTSAIAGGSSVIVNGMDITVTDDHEHATYGGMAPGAELFLCGIKGMGAAQIANAFHRMCNYADSVGKPLVVSNSYGDFVYNREVTSFITVMAVEPRPKLSHSSSAKSTPTASASLPRETMQVTVVAPRVASMSRAVQPARTHWELSSAPAPSSMMLDGCITRVNTLPTPLPVPPMRQASV